ncbi:MAG TPA: aspartate--ammonia ligase [Candidatus Eisenbacteria bacterium]|nr:aspartate--ammonia ligase [Candidatus Eisenbacteria bacterium]
MINFNIPQNYRSDLDLIATQKAIKSIKDNFERNLAERLNLLRVSAPLFVKSSSGLNDDLTGVEKPVSFMVEETPGNKIQAEIVQSLAKWKRFALAQYKFRLGTGLYTDMNAIRADEVPDNTHSYYVDQWDWEKVISIEERNLNYLHETVNSIFEAFLDLENQLLEELPFYESLLPEEVTFISAQELEDLYPEYTPEEREDLICKDKKFVFLEKIGHDLISGIPHSARSPDYDDWTLNGDILVWSPVINRALELSSMGVRVDAKALLSQLETAGATDRMRYPYHKKLLKNELPLTIGGGIGQSRICMFFLQKLHIGEVQASIWPQEMIDSLKEEGIELL